jgi:hypothetical protein
MSHTLGPDGNRGVSWGRGSRGPAITIHAEAAHRAGAERFLRDLNAVVTNMTTADVGLAKLAVLDGPTPSFLIVTLACTP